MSKTDFDRIAGAWLAEGPTELNDRVLDAALDEVHLTSQRRRTVPWRTSPMSFPMRLAAAAIAVIAVGVLAVNLPRIAGIATTPTVGPSPTTAPSPTVEVTRNPPTTEPIPTGTPVPGLAFPSGTMPAGTYHSAAFQPTIILTLPVGWTHRYEDTEGLVLEDGNLSLYVTHGEALAAAEDRAHLRGFTTAPATLGRFTGSTTNLSAPADSGTTIFNDAGLRAWDSEAGWVTRGWVIDLDGNVVEFDFFGPPAEVPDAMAGMETLLGTLGQAP